MNPQTILRFAFREIMGTAFTPAPLCSLWSIADGWAKTAVLRQSLSTARQMETVA